MATYTDNYQLTKPTYAEQADIGVINSNMNIIDDIMHSSQISLAPAYDSTKSYAEGDKVMYELLMYKCISPTTGVWDGSKWERTTASESGGGGSAELDILGEGNGAVVSFADGASAELAKCIAEINPTQDLHGYDKPWAGGAGKNKAEGRYTWNINASGEIEETSLYATSIVKVTQGTTYTFSVDGVKARIDVIAYFTSYPQIGSTSYNNSRDTFIDGTFTAPITGYATIRMSASIGDMMVEKGSNASSYEPYSNICPISGSTSVTVTVSDRETSTTKTTPLGQTVYGGRLNVLTGELVIDREFISFDGSENWQENTGQNGYTLYNILPTAMTRGNGISNEFYVQTSYYTDISLILGQNNRHLYAIQINNNISGVTDLASWKTWLSNNNCQICFEVVPQTVQLTPQEVNSLLGQNNISADTGDVDIVYVKASAPIQPNPTGTPTATLTKLGIEGTVFELEGGGGGSSAINYSTTEQVIGTWIDGKPLYQKTFDLTAVQLTDNTWNANILGTIGIRIKHFEGLFSIGQTEPSMKYDYYRSSSEYFTAMLVNDASDINVRPNINAGTIYAGIVTIQYTKITD